MSAAFSLDYSGDPVPCDFRGCILEAWHEGEHEFPAPKLVARRADFHCVVCGQPFDVYGAGGQQVFRTCGAAACVEHWARHHGWDVPVTCPCPQRDYPHELSVHALIRHEWWKKELRDKWPWSLMQSVREEPSTERRQDGV